MHTGNFEKLVDLKLINQNEEEAEFEVKIDASHPIFEGHFPERAILPGVAMIEIFRRAAEMATERSLRMLEAKSLKFLKMVEPSVIAQLKLKVRLNSDGAEVKAQGELYSGEDIYFKEMVTFADA